MFLTETTGFTEIKPIFSALSACSSARARDNFRSLLSVLLAAVFLVPSAMAQGPAWWYSRGAVDTNQSPHDYALITLGQLKWMATNACAEMNAYFGAGTGVTAVVNAFGNTANYYAANLGQLKYVAQPFYDRLYELSLTNTFPANMPGYYPWGNASQTNDYAAANLGQLKYAFSFDSAKDSDSDGISDWQETVYGTNPYNPDSDGDGLSDKWEIDHDTDPLDGNDYDQAVLLSEVAEARQRIIRHWLLIYGTAPAFTNTPGSAADLIDLREALNTLSGKFYKEE